MTKYLINSVNDSLCKLHSPLLKLTEIKNHTSALTKELLFSQLLTPNKNNITSTTYL